MWPRSITDVAVEVRCFALRLMLLLCCRQPTRRTCKGLTTGSEQRMEQSRTP